MGVSSRRLLLGSVVVLQYGLSLSSVKALINPVNVTNIISPNWPRAVQVSGHYLFSLGDYGFQVFDISNRGNPTNVASVPSGGFSLAVSDQYAYAVGFGNLTVFDISNPANPTIVSQTAGNWTTVSVSGHYAFLDSTIYDVSNPAHPAQLGQMAGVAPDSWTGNFVSVSGNYAYLAVDGRGLVVFDLSDPTTPKEVTEVKTAWSGNYGVTYAWDIALSGNFAFVCAFTNGMLQVFDISSPTNPVSVTNILAAPDAGRVSISGNFAYVIGYLGSTLNVIDISNPTNATLLGLAFTPGNTDAIAVAGDYSYLGETQNLSGVGVYSLGLPPPALNINVSSADAVSLSWPTPTGAFAVQQAPALNSSNWTTLTNTPVVLGAQNQVTIPKPQGTMFYRLVSE